MKAPDPVHLCLEPRAAAQHVQPAPGQERRWGRGRVAQPGEQELGSELKAGEAAPKFSWDSPGAAAALLLPPPPLLRCTFKWKIFRSQQKHCVQERLSRSNHQTLEETLPGKLPFGLFT